MDLKDNGFYSISESSKLIGVSTRKLQRIAKKLNLRLIDGRYLFTGEQLKKILLNDTTTTRQATRNTSSEIGVLKGDIYSGDLDIITNLKSALKELKTTLNETLEENRILKEKLSKEVPHQEKLKEAIQLITLEAMEQGLNHKVFTETEYQDIIGTISEVDFQKEQVQYLRGRVEKQDEVLRKLVNQVSERNYIEAKEKGLDR
jgi:hypothetical protein